MFVIAERWCKLAILLLLSFLIYGQLAFAAANCSEWHGVPYECSCQGRQYRVFIYVCTGIDGVGCDYGGGMETDCGFSGTCQIIDAELGNCFDSSTPRARETLIKLSLSTGV